MTEIGHFHWYVFYCRSRAEKKALEVLIEQNFNAYLPLITEIHQWSDRKKKIQVPLFRGYVFVYSTINDFFDIMQIYHIVSPVKIGDEYAKLRQTDIELLKKIEKFKIEASAIPLKVQNGDKVGIIFGPLKGYYGICMQELNKNYVLIAIEATSHFVKVNIPKENLKICK